MKDAKLLAEDLAVMTHASGKEKKIAAVKAIGKMNDMEMGKSVVQTLKDDDWEVRAMSASILGNMRFREAGHALVEAVCDMNWWVRKNAAEAIISMPENRELLMEVFKKNDTYAKESILSAIENSGRQLEFADIFKTASGTT